MSKFNTSKARQLIGLQVKFRDDGWEKWGEVLAFDEQSDEYTIRTLASDYQVPPKELVGVCIPKNKTVKGGLVLGYERVR